MELMLMLLPLNRDRARLGLLSEASRAACFGCRCAPAKAIESGEGARRARRLVQPPPAPLSPSTESLKPRPLTGPR